MIVGRWIAMAALALLSAGCRDAAPDAQAAVPVDTLHAPAEALSRFRDGLPIADSLSGGAASRDELVARFVDAIARQDTAAVRGMVLNRAEYGWIYFPSLQRMNPATSMQPEVMWMLHAQESQKGITRVLRRLGGGQARFGGYACEAAPGVEGPNRYWHACTVETMAADGEKASLKLFGSLIERGGRWKIVSYANDF
ncbi:hypothetical protein [Longimicrobium sp.]|uniref:hypothetical protein n=1 Tax=Longimicrobium sp. TaxID=2029185 RepID=UPI003B3A981A